MEAVFEDVVCPLIKPSSLPLGKGERKQRLVSEGTALRLRDYHGERETWRHGAGGFGDGFGSVRLVRWKLVGGRSVSAREYTSNRINRAAVARSVASGVTKLPSSFPPAHVPIPAFTFEMKGRQAKDAALGRTSLE